MTTRIFVAVLLLASIVTVTRTQEAKVILLSPPDATNAEITYKAMIKAQADWEKTKEGIREKYLTVGYGDPEADSEVMGNFRLSGTSTFFLSSDGNNLHWGQPNQTPEDIAKQKEAMEKAQAKEDERRKHAKYTRRGWEGSFEFSSDFRFIVPHKDYSGPYVTSGCTYFTPFNTSTVFNPAITTIGPSTSTLGPTIYTIH